MINTVSCRLNNDNIQLLINWWEARNFWAKVPPPEAMSQYYRPIIKSDTYVRTSSSHCRSYPLASSRLIFALLLAQYSLSDVAARRANKFLARRRSISPPNGWRATLLEYQPTAWTSPPVDIWSLAEFGSVASSALKTLKRQPQEAEEAGCGPKNNTRTLIPVQ